MKKKEAIRVELANENYSVTSIGEKTDTEPQRVITIIDNQIINGKLEGRLDEKGKHFLPGEVDQKYLRNIKYGLALQIIGIISLVTVIVIPILYFFVPGFRLLNTGFLIDYLIYGVVTLVFTFSGVIACMFIKRKRTKIIAIILNGIACLIVLLEIIAILVSIAPLLPWILAGPH